MAVGAVQPERRGKHPHGAHEFLDGNAFEHLDVLEDLFGQERLVLCRGQGGERADQAGRGEAGGREELSSGLQSHTFSAAGFRPGRRPL